jgi:hypothetical protein
VITGYGIAYLTSCLLCGIYLAWTRREAVSAFDRHLTLQSLTRGLRNQPFELQRLVMAILNLFMVALWPALIVIWVFQQLTTRPYKAPVEPGLSGSYGAESFLEYRQRTANQPAVRSPPPLPARKKLAPFVVQTSHLIAAFTLEEVEAQLMIHDPLGAVPAVPMGHLNAVWVNYRAQLTPKSGLWSFSADRPVSEDQSQILEGYVVSDGQKIGRHLIVSRYWVDI